MSEKEFKIRDEIEEAKKIIASHPDFNKLLEEEKIDFSLKLIFDLKEKKLLQIKLIRFKKNLK